MTSSPGSDVRAGELSVGEGLDEADLALILASHAWAGLGGAPPVRPESRTRFRRRHQRELASARSILGTEAPHHSGRRSRGRACA